MALSLFCVFSFSTFAHASEAKSIRAELKFKTNLGFEISYILQAKGRQIRINGFEMSKDEAVLHVSDIHTAVNTVSSTKRFQLSAPCSAGTYEHVVARGKFTKIEKGCIEETRFAELQTAYERMQSGF